MTTGLARVTISAPQRRVDVALPEQVPLAELLPEVLRHAGDGLADDGERHGGWVLRRTDGARRWRPRRRCCRRGSATARCCTWCRPARSGPSWSTTTWSRRSPTAPAAGAAPGRPPPPGPPRWPVPAYRSRSGCSPLLAGGPGAPRPAGWSPPRWRCCSPSPARVASRAYGDGAGRGHPRRLRPAVRRSRPAPWRSAPATRSGRSGRCAGWARPNCWPARWRCCWWRCSACSGWPPGCGSSWPARRSARSARPPRSAGCCSTPAGTRGGAALRAGLRRRRDCRCWPSGWASCRCRRSPCRPAPPGGAGRGCGTCRTGAGCYAAVARTEEMLTGMLLGHAVLAVAAAVGARRRRRDGRPGAGGGRRGRAAAAVPAVRGAAAPGAAGARRAGRVRRARRGAGRPGRPGRAAGAGRWAGWRWPWSRSPAGTTYARRPVSPYLGRVADLTDTALVVSVVPVACAVLDLYDRARGLLG